MHVLEPLHETYGIDISDKAIRAAIRDHNEISRVMTEIGDPLGQVEFLFSLLLTWFLFDERIRRNEWLGCGLIILSVVILLLGRAV